MLQNGEYLLDVVNFNYEESPPGPDETRVQLTLKDSIFFDIVHHISSLDGAAVSAGQWVEASITGNCFVEVTTPGEGGLISVENEDSVVKDNSNPNKLKRCGCDGRDDRGPHLRALGAF